MRRDVGLDLTPMLVDSVPIAVVLRNLIENALDAASGANERKEVAVRAHQSDNLLVIEV